MYTMVGIDNTTRQATTSKQVEILFKFTVVLVSDNVAILRRTFVEIWNRLKLRYANGRNTTIRKITKTIVLGMILSFVEIIFKVELTTRTTVRRVNSLRLVTDV